MGYALSWLAVAALGAAPAVSTAPAAPAAAVEKKSLPGEEVQLKTKDGWTLSARYQAAREGKYTFVLLHSAGGRKEDWMPLAKAMARAGYGYLALDLRGHGDSQNAPEGQPSQWRKFQIGRGRNDWSNISLDAEAAAEYLTALRVPEGAVAFGGADVGSSIALKYAATHPQVPLTFLLSPGMSYKEVNTVKAVWAYGKRPILLVVGADDSRAVRETVILFEFAKKAAGPENATLLNVSREHGTRMLFFNRSLPSRILEWAEHPAHPADGVALSTGAVEVSSPSSAPPRP